MAVVGKYNRKQKQEKKKRTTFLVPFNSYC